MVSSLTPLVSTIAQSIKFFSGYPVFISLFFERKKDEGKEAANNAADVRCVRSRQSVRRVAMIVKFEIRKRKNSLENQMLCKQ